MTSNTLRMKLNTIYILLFALMIAICACTKVFDVLRQMHEYEKFTVAPYPLKRSGNNVVFTMLAKVPKKLLLYRRSKKTQYTFEIRYRIGDIEKFIPLEKPEAEVNIGGFKFIASEYQSSNITPTQTKTFRFTDQDQYKKGFLVYYTFVQIGDHFQQWRGPYLITSNGKPVTGIE